MENGNFLFAKKPKNSLCFLLFFRVFPPISQKLSSIAKDGFQIRI